jgi:hypothetical protein
VFKKTAMHARMDSLLRQEEHLVADQAYSLSVHVMKPYQRPMTAVEHYFNYKQSAARRCVEQASHELCASVGTT